MSKVAVIYWSMTGNTQAMAEAVVQGVQEAGGEADLFSVDQMPGSGLSRYGGRGAGGGGV